MLTTGTSRTKKSVTESKPGVANKVYHNSREVPRTVPPANAGVVKPKSTVAVLCSWAFTALGDLLRPRLPNWIIKVPRAPLSCRETHFPFHFYVILAGVVCFQYKGKIQFKTWESGIVCGKTGN